MEDQEEFFIVRYRGPPERRDAIHYFLTSQSNDFNLYSSLQKDMQIGRATCLKELMEFVTSPKSTQVVHKKQTAERQTKNQHGKEKKPETFNIVEDVKVEMEERSVHEEQEAGPSTSASILPRILEQLADVKTEVTEEQITSHSRSLPSVPQTVSRRTPQIYKKIILPSRFKHSEKVPYPVHQPSMPKRPPISHSANVNGQTRTAEPPKLPTYRKPQISTFTERSRNQPISSLTLIRHNILLLGKTD